MRVTNSLYKSISKIVLAIFLLTMFLTACGDTPTPTATTNASIVVVSSTPTPLPLQTAPSGTVGSGSSIPAATVAPGNNQGLGPGLGGSTTLPAVPQTRTIINLWTGGWKGNADYEKFLNQVIDDYRKLYPLITFDWRDYGDGLAAEITKVNASDPKATAPDLVLLSPTDFYQLAYFNGLESLNDYTEFTSKRADYLPGTLDAFKVGSSYYGVPWVGSTRLMLINKKLWQQAELDIAKLPRTYEELEAVIQPLARKTADDVKPIWLKPDPLSDFLMEDLPLFQVGADGKSRTGAFNNPITQGRWTYFQNNLNRGGLIKEALDGTSQEAYTRFVTGKLAVWLDGGDYIAQIKAQNTDFYNQSLLVSAYPTAKSGLLPFNTRGVWAVPKGSRAKGRAADFMTFISNDQNQLAFAKIAPSGVVVPTVSKSYTDAFISSTGEPISQARNIISNALPNTRVPENTLPYPISSDTRTKLINALNDAQRKMWNGTQPGQALFEADKIWNDLLK